MSVNVKKFLAKFETNAKPQQVIVMYDIKRTKKPIYIGIRRVKYAGYSSGIVIYIDKPQIDSSYTISKHQPHLMDNSPSAIHDWVLKECICCSSFEYNEWIEKERLKKKVYGPGEKEHGWDIAVL